MPRYLTVNGHNANKDDPQRLVWYGRCGYWTDDWGKLAKTASTIASSGIPCCPKCGIVGMQCSAGDWESGAKEYDKKEPGYLKFLNDSKENCLALLGGMLNAWNAAKDIAKHEETGKIE
jgi:hypothetical protein